MKMEPTVSSETSAIRTQTPDNYPKRNKLQIPWRLHPPPSLVLRLQLSGVITLLLLYTFMSGQEKVPIFYLIIRSCINTYFYKLKTFLQQIAINKGNKRKIV